VTAARIARDDPRTDDIRALLDRHHAFAHLHSPPEDVHALDVDRLVDPAITFLSLRVDGDLVGVAALKELDATHGEVKSMHVAEEQRGTGAGRALLDQVLATARQRGYRRVSLETGSMAAFAPARALYESVGFRTCGPFDGYVESPHSAFLTLELDDDGAGGT
jgi:putative acetyltransferase